MNLVNFTPVPGSCKGLAVTATTASAQIYKGPQTDIYLYNSSTTDPMFIEFGGSTVAATEATTSAAGSLIIGPGTTQVLRGCRGDNSGIYIAAIMSSTKSGTLFYAPGNGS